jgi:hypothetical protein
LNVFLDSGSAHVKDGKKVSVVVKKTRYLANLEELRKVLDGRKSYTCILGPSETKKTEEVNVKNER